MREHDNEPVWGLPGRPPAGEQVLWQGAPDWRALGRRALHARKIALYLGVLLVWSAAEAVPFTQESALTLARNAGLAAAAMGLIALFAMLTARTTAYTVTNRRVVLRFGIALPATLNLPYALIDGAGLRVNADGTGDLALTLASNQRLAFLLLWPHARPWKLAHAQPSLRAIPDAGRVAQLLSRALAAAAEQAPSLQSAAALPAAAAIHAPAAA